MSYMSLARAAVFSSSFVSPDSSRLEPPPRAHTTAVDIPCCPPARRRAAAAALHAIHAPPTPPALCPPVLHARSLHPRRPPLRPRAARVPPPPSASTQPPLPLHADAHAAAPPRFSRRSHRRSALTKCSTFCLSRCSHYFRAAFIFRTHPRHR